VESSDINRSDGDRGDVSERGRAEGAPPSGQVAEVTAALSDVGNPGQPVKIPDDRRSTAGEGAASERPGGDGSAVEQARHHQRLVERCLSGDEGAWEQLYRECHPPLLRAIKLLLGPDAGDVHLADEMAARVWYALLRDGGRLLASYDAARDSSLNAFLMGLARIEIMRHMRSERRRRSYEFIGGRRILAEGRVPDWQLAAMMDEFSSTLTAQERRFMEKFLLEASEPEPTTDQGELSASSIWQRRHRIRRKLKAFFDDY
jgi:DNA-directed RNA polymerase specialized sigma24 family protein